MLQLLKTRLEQGHKTLEKVSLPERFRGLPVVKPHLCQTGCDGCAAACPTGAIELHPFKLDLAKCVFCTACTDACTTGAVEFTRAHTLSFTSRAAMVLDGREPQLARELDAQARSLFGRSLRLRHVSAGDCSGCGAELAALSNVVFDLARFGIQFVASPRHADGIVISGPVTPNMKLALQQAYEATPAPKLVIAVGACALSGGPFEGGVPPEFPVDLSIAGCPPHPVTVLDGLLRVLGRLSSAPR